MSTAFQSAPNLPEKKYGPDPIDNTVSLTDYGVNYIDNYETVTSIPQENLNYLNSLGDIEVTSMKGFLKNMPALTTLEGLNWSKLNTANCLNFSEMFYYDDALTEIDLTGLNTSSVIYFNSTFARTSITSIDLSKIDLTNVQDIRLMFYYTKLISIDLSKETTGLTAPTNMMSTFAGCSDLVSINMSGVDTSKVYMYHLTFNGCEKLTTLTLDNNILDFSSVSATDKTHSMFNKVRLTTPIHLTNYPYTEDDLENVIGGIEGITWIVDSYQDAA